MIDDICAEIRNYFTEDADKHIGYFQIRNGSIEPSFEIPTDYIRIVGSRQNDGVHRLSDMDLIDEGLFRGAIWVMTPPRSFLRLVEEISSYERESGKIIYSPYTSESFAGYSYTKGNAEENSWKRKFGTQLNLYRRLKL